MCGRSEVIRDKSWADPGPSTLNPKFGVSGYGCPKVPGEALQNCSNIYSSAFNTLVKPTHKTPNRP